MTVERLVANTDAGIEDKSRCSTVRATYRAAGGHTWAARVFESGAFRLRHPRANGCEAMLVNTGGGIVAGDKVEIDLELGPAANATLTSCAAEKVYRADGHSSTITARLKLDCGSRLAWIPQETILFDRARMDRRFDIDVTQDSKLLAAEIVLFGRAEHGEHEISGRFRDSWRLRRDGRLVFADETLIEGPIGAILDRRAVAMGARGVAFLLLAAPDAEASLEPLRATITAQCEPQGPMDGAASHRDGIILARFVGRTAERLRKTMIAALETLDFCSIPRVWL